MGRILKGYSRRGRFGDEWGGPWEQGGVGGRCGREDVVLSKEVAKTSKITIMTETYHTPVLGEREGDNQHGFV